ncbi:MAG: LysR family transcriptional regulator [Oscillospiraceae bacterium]
MITSLEHCKVFYYAAKLSSITLAAQQLYISQPAVSQSVRQLEQDLGCKLFSRSARGVALTAEGRVFYEHVRRGYEEILTGEKKLAGMLSMDAGELRIGASDMTLQFFLLPHLEEFHRLYPRVKINVSNGPTPETLRLLKSGGIDFGVVSTPFEAAGVTAVPVRQIEDVAVAGEKFRAIEHTVLPLRELEKLPVICLEKTTSARRAADEFLLENGVRLAPEIELATSELIVKFAQRSLGVGIVVRAFAAGEIEAGRLFALRLEKPFPPREICVVTNEKATMSVAAQKLHRLMLEGTN